MFWKLDDLITCSRFLWKPKNKIVYNYCFFFKSLFMKWLQIIHIFFFWTPRAIQIKNWYLNILFAILWAFWTFGQQYWTEVINPERWNTIPLPTFIQVFCKPSLKKIKENLRVWECRNVFFKKIAAMTTTIATIYASYLKSTKRPTRCLSD